MNSEKGFVFGVIAVLIIILLVLSMYIVPAGKVGVVTRFGAVNRTVTPGMGFKIPLIESVKKMSVQTQKEQVDAASASKDLQIVTAVIAVNYHLDGQYATNMYNNVGRKYQEIIVSPAIQDVFKGTTAKFNAEDLIQNREAVSVAAEAALQEKLTEYHIIVENFNIINFDFSPEYNAAIEAKQVAQQEVQTSKQLLEKAKIDAETQVVEAQGQADAQKALKDTGGLSEEYLQYLFLTKWDGTFPEVMGGTVPMFDVSKYFTDQPIEMPE